MGFYKRGWSHSKSRGKEKMVSCSFCGKMVPRYKTFTISRAFKVNDPLLKAGSRGRMPSILQSKMHACPACARHRKIVRKKR